jgi:hypothetical protein
MPSHLSNNRETACGRRWLAAKSSSVTHRRQSLDGKSATKLRIVSRSSVVMPDCSSMVSPGFQEARNAFTRATASLRSGAWSTKRDYPHPTDSGKRSADLHVRRGVVERLVQASPEALHSSDCCNGDKRGNQAVLDRGRAARIPKQCSKIFQHDVRFPFAGKVRGNS